MSKHTISITKTTNPKPRPDENNLVFGKYYSDHMFIMDYDAGQGWHDPRVVPYGNISLDPAAKVFHYGQTIFEGLKAYRTDDNRVVLFRPDENWKRLNRSNDRLSIPAVDPEIAFEALCALIDVDREWVPSAPGTSLYIRPYVIATEPQLGVSPSTKYMFMIILCPVGAYYSEGLNPVPIHVESEYVRAVKGGVGNAKTAGNYAASLKAQEGAAALGYSQVLWLDGVHRKYIEEVGSMNVFFKINGTVVTPALNGSILEGITRKSVLQLLRSWNIPVEERELSIDELVEAHRNGKLEEAFGTGTAAVISPIGALHYQDEKLTINEGKTGELSSRVYDTITGIQRTELPDPFGWVVEV
ncbi:branched-chain amino acid aminotransferase [Paenibacillus curdlanolyticus YK9]|uniref:Branched-chain-amino-acid aminotransferase n=1 Tax=Paenibacillus curdlanolyticus YK9 TaxID=717606 RepID=E0IDF0_9BACL|nr:branched-chain amino acid aminotransferase [Paenibacillus curdlanolyticus]EFM09605.1 branched-chain amino acid aminotransferase [Paenibacillus curdlanolyticus YK9]